MTNCKIDGCPLTRVADIFPELDGIKRDLCYRHQDDHIRAEQRRLRALHYQHWIESGVSERARVQIEERMRQ